ncbi:hypothetical protein EON67_11280 [archaeon]|nr:MAG: hypothetical protein EON67_11280 [archaeon]
MVPGASTCTRLRPTLRTRIRARVHAYPPAYRACCCGRAVATVGDVGVGKTNLLSQFLNESFSVKAKPTLGPEVRLRARARARWNARNCAAYVRAPHDDCVVLTGSCSCCHTRTRLGTRACASTFLTPPAKSAFERCNQGT